MRPYFSILTGDCLSLAKTLPSPVHCVVTSPPYFNQRKYGHNSNEIGDEKDVDEYISTLVDLFDSINLHPLGSIWVNIGDKRKDGALLNIPARFVEAMRQRGYRLIDSVIWAKLTDHIDGTTSGNCMTEPCYGRLNERAYEPIFRFTKNKKCWSDTMAVQVLRDNVNNIRYLPEDLMKTVGSLSGRNLHNVWRVGMGQTSHKHYAVYPVELCERPIAMTCPPFVNGGVPLTRIVKYEEYDEGKGKRRVFGKADEVSSVEKKGRHDTGRSYIPRYPVHKGWSDALVDGVSSPGLVLDPFCGTGTTGEVALKLGRSFIGFELYPEYADIARQRCKQAFEFVDTSYGYDRVYESIMLATELRAKIND